MHAEREGSLKLKQKLGLLAAVGAVVAYVILTMGATRVGPIVVEDAWARPLPQVAESGEFYMVVRNGGSESDRLLGGRSPACGMIALWERYRTPQGAISMREVGPIEIRPGQRLELRVTGFHLMCMDKKQDFKSGVQFPLTLKFQKSGEITVQVTIRAQ
jgi:copper(I)-binding protein